LYAKAQIYRGTGYIIYDPNNLPISMYLMNGQNLVFETDVNGNRVRNTIAGNSDNFYYNGADGKTEAVALAAYDSNMVYNITQVDRFERKCLYLN
jgi:hypothetical protein